MWGANTGNQRNKSHQCPSDLAATSCPEDLVGDRGGTPVFSALHSCQSAGRSHLSHPPRDWGWECQDVCMFHTGKWSSVEKHCWNVGKHSDLSNVHPLRFRAGLKSLLKGKKYVSGGKSTGSIPGSASTCCGSCASCLPSLSSSS